MTSFDLIRRTYDEETQTERWSIAVVLEVSRSVSDLQIKHYAGHDHPIHMHRREMLEEMRDALQDAAREAQALIASRG